MQYALQRELKRGQKFFDIGANAGFFSIIALKCVGPEGCCISFDPSPDNCASIVEQLALNNMRHGCAVQEAIAGEDGVMMFSFSASGSAVGHLGAARSGEQQLNVKTTTIDSACDRFGPPHLIKMDIEGAEVDALMGATRALREFRPIWIIELHGPICEERVREILNKSNYIFFDLDGRMIESERLPHHVIVKPRELCLRLRPVCGGPD